MTRRQAGTALSANSCRYPVHYRAFPRASRPVMVVDDTIEAPRDIAPVTASYADWAAAHNIPCPRCH